ncbi:AbrB/MazE/SpoVT family DNA-binding domain-containing protein [Sphingomonas hengshuiensis]|uniref:AbrB/MazE/SpoVT family DNA-binding domain-containing protein n=1 Tax=Sphingomonas hengshuiensis TaxID=1609977 RepID=A0A7U4J842_9SPHN|nr:AbrB/MazE/SpoVT family DNA-binding domain-containing protein [Sphingomonas hengshuiensis]AJP71948.1 hypothetical protein TS85_09355 [Sphingomonas hengshuiensis]
MTKEYRARTFKSGNSVALRLPKGLGVKEGEDVVLREEAQGFKVEVVPALPKKIDVSGFAGKIPWLKPIPPEDRLIEERELDWDGKRLKRD